MPALTQIKTPIKMLLLGDSGVGKTGSLWSLAAAGFKIKLYDADQGFGVLNAACSGHPKAAANIEVNSFTNQIKFNDNGFPIPVSAPKAWTGFLKALNQWPDDPLSGPTKWGPDTIVVIDSLTKLGRHALLNAMHVEGKTGRQPEIQHYGNAMGQLEGMISMLYSDHVKCHVIIMTHVSYEKNELGAMFGLPMSLGEKLAPIIPTYFNTMLVASVKGKKRILSTKPAAMVQTKVEQFSSVKDEYLLAEDGKGMPGMAEFFADCGWKAPGA